MRRTLVLNTKHHKANLSLPLQSQSKSEILPTDTRVELLANFIADEVKKELSLDEKLQVIKALAKAQWHFANSIPVSNRVKTTA